MKKTFKLEHPKIKAPRLVDSMRHEIKKFLKSERRKPLPQGAKYWTFECKLAETESSAVSIPFQSLTESIDTLVENNAKTIYIELNAVPVDSEAASSRGARDA